MGPKRPTTEKGTIRKKTTGIPKDTPRPGAADSDGKFKMILDAAADAVVVFDRGGKISYWNRAAEKLLGYKAKEAIGMPLEVIIPERYREEYRHALESSKKEKRLRPIHQSFESEVINKTGKEFPIAASVSTAEVHGMPYFIGIVRDISPLRAAQTSLADSLARYQLMHESQRDGIILVDMETQRFLEANRAAGELYGYSRDEMLKKRIVEVFAGADKDGRLTLECAKEVNIFKHKRKDGSIFPVEMTGCVLLWKNRKTFCAIVRDASVRSIRTSHRPGKRPPIC